MRADTRSAAPGVGGASATVSGRGGGAHRLTACNRACWGGGEGGCSQYRSTTHNVAPLTCRVDAHTDADAVRGGQNVVRACYLGRMSVFGALNVGGGDCCGGP
jgi:hypothetical protein